MNTQNLAIAGLILLGTVLIGDRVGLAKVFRENSTLNPTILIQNSRSEISEGELKTWCSQAGGIWLGKSCEWQELLSEDEELSLDRQCGDRGGIWQTLYEEMIGPGFCGNGFCTGDAVVIDYVEKGVGCVWEAD
jgi:hypothetical protein